MDREALNDFPMGEYDVTVSITTFEPDREIAWTILGQLHPPIGHVYGYTLEPADDGTTLVTSYYDWSDIDPVWKEANIFPIISEGARRDARHPRPHRAARRLGYRSVTLARSRGSRPAVEDQVHIALPCREAVVVGSRVEKIAEIPFEIRQLIAEQVRRRARHRELLRDDVVHRTHEGRAPDHTHTRGGSKPACSSTRHSSPGVPYRMTP